MKLNNEDKKFYIVLALILISILIYTRPQSFGSVMKGFNRNEIIRCEAYYSLREDIDGKAVITSKFKQFDTSSEDYNELLELLSSAYYRRHISNFFIGGNKGMYSINLNPYASIYFYDGTDTYEYCLYGKDMVIGKRGNKYDYTPKGRTEFQKKAVEFINTHGTVVEENKETY